MKEQIDQLLQSGGKLPKMSGVVVKVLELVQKPDVSIHDLAQEISKDPSLTTAIIKISNSAYYRASKPIRTVQESLMTLGIKVVREIVLLTASKGILNQDLQGYKLEADDNWLHCLVVAELSMRIAAQKKIKDGKDVAFTAGLLHDIGKIVLADFFPQVMMQIKQELPEFKGPFTDLEKKYFGYTHSEVGAMLLEKWQFPSELVEVVRFHHDPDLAKDYPELVSCVHVANIVTIVSGIGIDIGGISHPLSPFALEKLGVKDSDLQLYYTLIPEMQKHISELLAV